MPESDLLQRMLDAGMQFTAESQKRAEALVRDFLGAGDQAAQAQAAVTDLLARTREETEKLVDSVWDELRHQIDTLAAAGRDALTRLDEQVAEWRAAQDRDAGSDTGDAAVTAALPATVAAPVKKAAKKAGAKAGSGKHANAKAADAKARSAKKASAKKTAAKKATATTKRAKTAGSGESASG